MRSNAVMHTYPSQASIDLVRAVTGQDLSGLTRDDFIAKLETLAAEQEELESTPGPDGRGAVTITLRNIGLGTAALKALLDIERQMRLN